MLCEREQWQSCGLCRMLSQYSFIGMQSCVGLMCVEKVKHSVLSMIECSNFTCTSRFLWLVTALTYVVEWNDDYIMIYYITVDGKTWREKRWGVSKDGGARDFPYLDILLKCGNHGFQKFFNSPSYAQQWVPWGFTSHLDDSQTRLSRLIGKKSDLFL